MIFGSAARGEAEEGSDLDLLVLTGKKASYRMRNSMPDIVFEVNLKYGTNISIVVVDSKLWHNGIMALTPLYAEVQRDGIPL
ncbi:MAG: nucleotidyltransferase family protein [bacterium]